MIGNISSIDNFIILLYFGIVMVIGLYYSKAKDRTTIDYFLGGRHIGWVAVGLTLFATNISSEHVVGLAGTSAERGLAAGQFEWLAVIMLILLGWFIAPVLLKSGVFTVPQFFGERFDRKTRNILTAVSILAYILTKISVMLFAGGVLLNQILGWDMFTSTVLIVVLTGLYTIIGGIHSVIRTQIFQVFVLIIGSLLLTIYGIAEVGGIGALFDKLPAGHLNIFKPMSDPDFPWTGILFGAPILGIWYWCTDQYIVQRVLCAKGVSDVRKGTLLTAFLKIIPIFLLLIPGLIAVVLKPDISGNEAYTFLLSGDILPAGIKGIVVAGLFAAMMSSLSSVFNSSATLFTIDIYKQRKPDASESELVLIGRLSTIVIVVLAILWIPIIKLIDNQDYIYLQSVQAFISPPIVVVFLFGFFWKRSTSKAALITLLVGGTLGFLRLAYNLWDKGSFSVGTAFRYFFEMNYLHFAIVLFLFCSVLFVSISYATEEKTDQSKRKNYMFNFESTGIPSLFLRFTGNHRWFSNSRRLPVWLFIIGASALFLLIQFL